MRWITWRAGPIPARPYILVRPLTFIISLCRWWGGRVGCGRARGRGGERARRGKGALAALAASMRTLRAVLVTGIVAVFLLLCRGVFFLGFDFASHLSSEAPPTPMTPANVLAGWGLADTARHVINTHCEPPCIELNGSL